MKKAGALSLGAILALSGFAAVAYAQTATTTGTTTNATSTDGTSNGTTTNGTSTATTTPNRLEPQVFGVLVWNNSDGRGATVTWNTDVPATSHVLYGTGQNNLSQSTSLDSTLTTNHSVVLTDLFPASQYFFKIESSNSAGTMNPEVVYLFATLDPNANNNDNTGNDGSNGTSTGTSTDDNNNNGNNNGTSTGTSTGTTTNNTSSSTEDLQERISNLEGIVSSLRNQISNLMSQIQNILSRLDNGNGGSNGGGNGTTTPSESATITPQNASVRAGTSIDFNGRNFWADESVRVSESGTVVTTARADGGGNFSTGSIHVSQMTGSHTYTFTGEQSGIVRTATYTVTQ